MLHIQCNLIKFKDTKMDWQVNINIAIGAALSVIGWFARQLWEAVQKLQNDLHQIEIDMPSNYMKRIDIDPRFDKLESLLEKVFDKLDKKVDK